jgi:cytochrome P450
VVQETLRLKSAAPLFFMEANEDMVLGDLRVEAGAAVWLLTRALALQSESFQAPLAFDPARWLGSSGSHDPRASLAFGAGPRVCPGRSLALLESAAVGAMVARNFDVALAEGSEPVERLSFTMKPVRLRIRFSPRPRV